MTSSIATLTVGYQCPFINGLSDQTVIQGSNVTFNSNIVLANPYPTLQWQTNFVNVDGATNLSLTLYNVQYNALNNATISLIASNAACIVTNSATLTVIVPPSQCPSNQQYSQCGRYRRFPCLSHWHSGTRSAMVQESCGQHRNRCGYSRPDQ